MGESGKQIMGIIHNIAVAAIELPKRRLMWDLVLKILTSQNLVLSGLMHSTHFFVVQSFDYLLINHHCWLSRLDCYLSDVAVNVYAHLSQSSKDRGRHAMKLCPLN